ncbi:MAG: ureidoglycolate lyase [Rhodobacteraceae bacterium]|nr:ureidoglycolate lyase [Paracoccaceae bacterium]MCY4249689.1 ureidoglycolate lyase [Paracoccaceae bacterium]MCY4309479.1 ureidoglycolate lyase [Paracoccaceae bacterium]
MAKEIMEIKANLISDEKFYPFGEIIRLNTTAPITINQGECFRFNDLANLDHDPDGRMGISIFESSIRTIPHQFNLVERHPHGCQFFLSMDNEPFLIIVAPDQDGMPGTPKAFITGKYQGINFNRGTWHGVLTPIQGSGKFLVIDWIGPKENLEEYIYPDFWKVVI